MAELKKDFPTIQLNYLEQFTVSETLQTSLPVSQFPINEIIPTIDVQLKDIVTQTGIYQDELERHPSFQNFGYYQNPDKIEQGTPKVLVFQGSYMNTFGYKYLINALGEYIYVHDYQNILDFPYYYNIFKPDCVVFEVAEYTLTNSYFAYERMVQLNMNPPLSAVMDFAISQSQQELDTEYISVDNGTQLTKIIWHTDSLCEYVWISFLENVYDMRPTEEGYEVTILTSEYDSNMDIAITAYDGLSITVYQ